MGIRVGIVGWGEIAREHASHLAAGGAELGAIVSRRTNLAVAVPVFQSLEEMLPSVDAVIVTVPNHLHARSCLLAIRAGKPVLVEKPLCIAAHELNELERAFEDLKVPVRLGYRLRRNPSMLALKSRVRNPRRIECTYRLGIEKHARGKAWARQLALTGGSFFALGVHSLDLARWLVDARGRALEGLDAGAAHRDESADYPLDVWLSGTLPSGVRLVAGADLRGDADSCIDLRVFAEEGCYPDPTLPPPGPEDEKIEYAVLVADFIRAVENNHLDVGYLREVLQTHRELLAARDLASLA